MRTTKNRIHIGATLVVILSMLLAAGCASGPSVDSGLASKFAPSMEIGEGESLVYVIRQKTMLGAGMPIYIGFDDKIIADLKSGTYVVANVPKGIHTFSVEQRDAFKWLAVDDRSGEIVFLYFRYDNNSFAEIDPELGKTLVMKSKAAKAFDKDFLCFALDDSILNPSLVGLSLMKEGGAEIQPDAEHAVVTFYRTKALVQDDGVAVWCDKEFIGNLPVKHAFRAKIPAGRHLFSSTARWTDTEMADWLGNVTKSTGKNTWVSAELEAGKEYLVNLESGIGNFGRAVAMDPAKPDDKTKATIASLKGLVLDESAITDKVRARLEAAREKLDSRMPESTVKLIFEKGIELDASYGF